METDARSSKHGARIQFLGSGAKECMFAIVISTVGHDGSWSNGLLIAALIIRKAEWPLPASLAQFVQSLQAETRNFRLEDLCSCCVLCIISFPCAVDCIWK